MTEAAAADTAAAAAAELNAATKVTEGFRLQQGWAGALLPPLFQVTQQICTGLQQPVLTQAAVTGSALQVDCPFADAQYRHVWQHLHALLINLLCTFAFPVPARVPVKAAGEAAAVGEVAAAAAEAVGSVTPKLSLHGIDGSPPSLPFNPAVEQNFAGVVHSLEGFVWCCVAAGRGKVNAATMISKIVNLLHSDGCPILTAACTAGPGSTEQKQLYSFLASMLKLARVGLQRDAAALEVLSVVLYAVLKPVEAFNARLANRAEESGAAAAAVAAAGTLSSDADEGSGRAAACHVLRAETASATSHLPSLFLFGCCFWSFCGVLQQLVPGTLQQLQQQQQAGLQASDPAADDCNVDQPVWPFADLVGLSGPLPQLSSHPAPSAQLAEAGYQPQVLLEALRSFHAAQHTAEECICSRSISSSSMASEAEEPAAAALQVVAQRLREVGEAFSCVAVAPVCNNPACSNISGPSELQLVSGRSCLCGGCRIAHYCSRACQRAHWERHKPVCPLTGIGSGCCWWWRWW